MRAVIDTNVLVRAALSRDDEEQSRQAKRVLASAEFLAISLPVLCEFVWVLRQRYRLSGADCAEAIRAVIASATAGYDRAAVEAGLAMLDVGGDFADGVIAFEGLRLGGEVFVSFDRKAVAQLKSRDRLACLVADWRG
ncbi:MAG: type II toxin-antitoxin system VapC family toxin [Caulobacteraceae bacterium]